MQLSHRIETLTPGGSNGWEIFLKAKAMIAAGQPVIELTIGEHDIRTDTAILGAMDRSARGGHTGYAEIPGVAALRDAVAARITERTGVATGRDNVLITPGGQAGLFSAHCATCDAGDAALFIDPYYVTYPGTVRAAGARPVTVPARPEDGFRPRGADILAAAGADAKSLLINTPNNPTGAVYDRETLEGIGRAVLERDLWLLSDEVYDTQLWDGSHLSPRALPELTDRTLVIGSMSKSHAMTGSRCGWIVGPEEAIAHLINLATHTTYGVPGFVQDAALFALEQGDALEAEVAAPFRRRRALALEILNRQNVLRLLPPQGAMYVMLDVRATGMTGLEFAEALLEQHRIAVMPGASFGAAAAGHIRVAMTVEDSAFAAALETLCRFAASCCAPA
ncbi:pyridoxal phosphate-dependent aminotransferase [Pseudodonghicola flavimaris]|uniref:aspartate transaminase n=1 Tax=Pseudodonghicola flavimaris TaxID=3050036 RepID=A0ABT7EVY1_9RHOB|nr:aminotransferase class I/II-fold pyridoxal phosphate-dependent enzyme [Pseudodonghicola flavimaris]MDK3016454.1 aminotransferase class I/II-fold pyridoxal phosphate-dependent enzyme [Pseudodonghicola flavimaris]